MKKTRIISLILVFSLIFGVLSVLPVSAEETDSDSTAVEILAQNVVYDEKVQIAYAVDVPLAEAENVTVEYYLEDAPETVYKAELLDVNNPNYIYKGTNPIFATLGFHATDFTDVVYVTAYIGDKAPENAVYKRYSVAEYFYSRLYKDDYINKTVDETDDDTIAATKPDFNRKKLYLSMVDYGRYAQEVIINDKGGNVTLITDYCYLWTTEDGITINGAKSTLVAPGAAVTLAGADSYTATKVGGEPTDITASYTAEAGVIAKIAAKTVEDIVTVTDYESGAPYSDYVKSCDAEGNKITGDYPTGDAYNKNNLNIGLESAGGNHYLHVRTPAGAGAGAKTMVQLSNTVKTGNCYTFETKMHLVGLTNGYNFAQLRFVNNNNGDAVNLLLKGVANDASKANMAIVVNTDNCNLEKNTVLFNHENSANKSIGTGVWFTLRIEFYFGGAGTENAENTYMKLYVDDFLAFDGNIHWAMGAAVREVEITHLQNGYAQNVLYDDIFFTQTDKAYAPGNEYAE